MYIITKNLTRTFVPPYCQQDKIEQQNRILLFPCILRRGWSRMWNMTLLKKYLF